MKQSNDFKGLDCFAKAHKDGIYKIESFKNNLVKKPWQSFIIGLEWGSSSLR